MNVRETGSVLDGKYEIVQPLGSGGMGEVYLVRHLHLQETRVIKILRQDLAADPSLQKRFMREARLATQIKHPNVAILYDFSRLDDGSFYMVWEHIQGEEIGERLRRAGPFPVPVAVQLGIQALRGLEAIHASGVIHRDLSPDNLMIMEDRRGQPALKIIDLGLARTLEADANFEITQVGMFMGKLQYCSPEQAGASSSGQPLDGRSDIYSLGQVLYEMIAGRPPFDSENQAGFIFKRLAEDPLPLVGRNPDVEVPVELDRVVRKALERDRERRYPDVASFIQALERVARSLNAAETREIPVFTLQEEPPRTPAPRPAPPPPAPPPSRQKTSSDLSKAERDELLAQIERASRRTQEGSGEVARIEAALGSGKIEEAERMVAQLETSNPHAPGLGRVKERLAAVRESLDHQHRVLETEQVLNQYLQRKQLPLARLALETLCELSPAHPKRAHYEGWLGLLAEEVERDKRAEAALSAGRAALARKDLRAARRELENIARNDPSGRRAGAFREELEAVEREARQEAEAGEHVRRLEAALAEQRVADAERELADIAKLDLPRVTLDSYRQRVAEARALNEQQEKASRLEWLFRRHLEERDWLHARETAVEMGQSFPASGRSTEMFAEVDRLEAEHRRQQAVEQGVRQVEAFVEQGDAAKAELALKILLQMDPENRHRKRLEKQVRAMPR